MRNESTVSKNSNFEIIMFKNVSSSSSVFTYFFLLNRAKGKEEVGKNDKIADKSVIHSWRNFEMKWITSENLLFKKRKENESKTSGYGGERRIFQNLQPLASAQCKNSRVTQPQEEYFPNELSRFIPGHHKNYRLQYFMIFLSLYFFLCNSSVPILNKILIFLLAWQ